MHYHLKSNASWYILKFSFTCYLPSGGLRSDSLSRYNDLAAGDNLLKTDKPAHDVSVRGF